MERNRRHNMKYFGFVRSTTKPLEIEITKDKVFVASNIHPYEEKFEEFSVEGYEYEYYSYDKDEYIQHMSIKNMELEQQILDTQMALCEIYESMGGASFG